MIWINKKTATEVIKKLAFLILTSENVGSDLGLRGSFCRVLRFSLPLTIGEARLSHNMASKVTKKLNKTQNQNFENIDRLLIRLLSCRTKIP